jgi:hypothetical protein
LLFAVLMAAGRAVALTWPIAPRLGTAGRVESGDGRFSIWNVAWVARALTTNPRALYDANIFSPHDNALAFSEANLVAGVIAVPVWLLTGNALAASNFAILSAFVLAAVAMYSLVRYLTGHPGAAAVSAVTYAFCPYAFSHIPHIQLLMTFGPPLVLLCVHRLVDVPGVARGVWLGLALALQALACGYYGLYGGLAAGWGVLWLGVGSGRWRDRRYWAGALIAVVVALAAVLPFLVPYFEIRTEGFGRSIRDAQLFSANWRAYLASPLLLHRWMLPWLGPWGSWREVLFPGFVPIGLSIVALVCSCSRKYAARAVAPRYIVGFYLSLAALSMWASFGPDAGLYRWLYEIVPMRAFLRARARAGVLVTLSLAAMAAFGLSALSMRWHGRRRLVFVWGAVLFVILRSTPGVLPLVDAPEVSPVYRRLALLAPGPVIEFPYFSAPLERSRHTEYMLMSTVHWKPLINGYSDHIPGDAFADMRTLGMFPHPKAWEVMASRRARYVVVHWNLYPDEAIEALSEEISRPDRGLRLLLDAPGKSLFEVASWRERDPVETIVPATDSGG